MQRVGLGRDIHRLVEGRSLILGGVKIPYEKGVLGHSDGDVLVHAVIDAVLGAAALADIGELYPSHDPAHKDADSIIMLKDVWKKLKEQGWHLVNLDCVVVLESPKLLPYRNQICSSLAKAFDSDSACIFVKGKTNEGLGFLGTGEAVEAYAVCLLEK